MSVVADQALAIARRIRSPPARTRALTDVVSLLSPPESATVREEAFAAAIACRGEREIGAALFHVVWSGSRGEYGPQLIRRATEVARTFEDPFTLARLMRATTLPDKRPQRIADALAAARAIADPAERAAALADVPIGSDDVRRAEEVYGDALDAIASIDDPDARVAALLELAYRLPTSLKRRAVAMARAARDPVLRIRALQGAASNATQRLDDEAWAEALAGARRVDGPSPPAAALISLAHWRSDTRDVFWAQALEAIESMPDPRTRTEELAASVVNAPDSALPTVLDLLDGLHSDRARARVLLSMPRLPPPAIRRRAVAAARAFADPWARATALHSLVLERRRWDGSLDADAVRRGFEDTVAAARTIADPRPRARLLTSLVEHAREDEADDLLQEAYETAGDIADPLQRARALASVALLAAKSDPNGRPRVLAEALTAARVVERPAVRARALTRLAALHPLPERQPLYAETLTAIAAIVDEETRVDELGRLISDDHFRIEALRGA